MESVVCGVWSEECGVRRVRVKCRVWSVKCGV